jgi:hypothetical protein
MHLLVEHLMERTRRILKQHQIFEETSEFKAAEEEMHRLKDSLAQLPQLSGQPFRSP